MITWRQGTQKIKNKSVTCENNEIVKSPGTLPSAQALLATRRLPVLSQIMFFWFYNECGRKHPVFSSKKFIKLDHCFTGCIPLWTCHDKSVTSQCILLFNDTLLVPLSPFFLGFQGKNLVASVRLSDKRWSLSGTTVLTWKSGSQVFLYFLREVLEGEIDVLDANSVLLSMKDQRFLTSLVPLAAAKLTSPFIN